MRSTAITVLLLVSLRPSTVEAVWLMNGTPVTTAIGEQQYGVAIADGFGGAIVTWSDRRNGNYDIYAQRIAGDGTLVAGWPIDGLAISNEIGDQISPCVVTDGSGGALFAWSTRPDTLGSFDIKAQHIAANGAVAVGWPNEGFLVCSAAGSQDRVVAVSDLVGGAILAWDDSRAGDESSDVYALRVTNAGGIAPGWTSNGTRVCGAAGYQFRPIGVSDGAGGAIFTWEDQRAADPNVFALRISADGARASGWPVDGVPVCVATGYQDSPSIVTDGSGGAIIAWRDGRDSMTHSSDIYSLRLTGSGAIPSGWITNGTALCLDPNPQNSPVIVTDLAGGAIVAWQDYRDQLGRTYATRIDVDGTIALGWPINGLPISTLPFAQGNSTLTPDGSGGFLAAWQALTSTANGFDVYVQRRLGDGTLAAGWPAAGVQLCSLPQDQSAPTIVSDAFGGALVIWTDLRNDEGSYTNEDLYAMRVGADASPPVDVAGSDAMSGLDVWPNPFSSGVRIAPRSAARIQLDVFTASGRLVRSLGRTSGEPIVWDGRTASGDNVPAGVYVLRAVSAGRNVNRKLIYLRGQ